METSPPSPPRTVAVIDIGATSIRMEIAEISHAGVIRTLDTLTRDVHLGEDVFTARKIKRTTIEECVRILRSYKKTLLEYGIEIGDRIRVVATTAVREAQNRLAFLDRVYIATGIEVESIEESEVNRITYMGVQPQLNRDPRLAAAKAVVLEVGGGATELLVVRGGNVLFSDTHRLGSLRLAEHVDAFGTAGSNWRSLMESQINPSISRIREQVHTDGHTELIALGGDMRFAARHLLGAWDGRTLASISVDALESLLMSVSALNEDEVVHKFGVTFSDAVTLGTALLINLMLARALNLETILVSNTNMRHGLLMEMAAEGRWTDEFRNQLIRSAIALGRKCDFSEDHATVVAGLASQLFEQLRDEHELDSRHEVILHIAALLHEIGHFVGVRSNHKHAMYLIRNSELFGMNQQDIMLVSLVARYYRRAHPQPSHEGYGSLNRNDRVAVSKMAAILRLAIALAESRSGRIKEVECLLERDRLVLQIPRCQDVSIEQLAMRQNSSLFEEVFGLPVTVRGQRV